MTRAAMLIVLALTLGGYPLWGYSGGPPDGFTGAPGEETCVTCHADHGLNTGSGMLTIDGPASFEAGQSYTIAITLQQPGQSRWGFEFSPLDQGTCVITNPVSTQLSVSGGYTYVKHTTTGTSAGDPGPVTWTFDWTTPAEPPASITFYATGNAANNDGGTGGDYVYTATHSMGLVPVELVRFGASYEPGAVILRWTTLSECDNAGFRVYRRQGNDFSLISSDLIPGAGSSAVPRYYRFEDSAVRPGNEYWYRLVDVSIRGRRRLVGGHQ